MRTAPGMVHMPDRGGAELTIPVTTFEVLEERDMGAWADPLGLPEGFRMVRLPSPMSSEAGAVTAGVFLIWLLTVEQGVEA